MKSMNVWSNSNSPRLEICMGIFVLVVTLVFSQMAHSFT